MGKETCKEPRIVTTHNVLDFNRRLGSNRWRWLDTDIMGPPNPAKKKAFSKSAITIEIERERLLFERHRMNMNLKSNIWNWRWHVLTYTERQYIDSFIRI